VPASRRQFLFALGGSVAALTAVPPKVFADWSAAVDRGPVKTVPSEPASVGSGEIEFDTPADGPMRVIAAVLFAEGMVIARQDFAGTIHLDRGDTIKTTWRSEHLPWGAKEVSSALITESRFR